VLLVAIYFIPYHLPKSMWAHGHQVVFFFPSFFEMEIYFFFEIETTKRPPSGLFFPSFFEMEIFYFFKLKLQRGHQVVLA